MTNASDTLRALILYVLVLPVALVVGYMIATPYDLTTWATVGLVFGLLVSPLLLRYHYPMLFFSWNMTMVVFFLPGHPELWIVMSIVSLAISVLQRTIISQMRFLLVPSILLPVTFLATVIYVTARLTGGIGLNIFGSATVGGKRYVLLFAAMVGFLAMTARGIPPHKVWFYVGIFFLAELTNIIGSTAAWVPPPFQFIFWVFPVDAPLYQTVMFQGPTAADNVPRINGAAFAGVAACYYLLARYGLRGLVEKQPRWRPLLFIGCALMCMLGGFRSFLILLLLAVAFMFWLEKMFRPKYLIATVLLLALGGAAIVPLANRLPFVYQRALSFLPLDLDPAARSDAEESSRWRLEMWKDVLPDIPRYFWLGKGLAIDPHEIDFSRGLEGESRGGNAFNAKISQDYHNGPLSVIIPFGIFGAIGWLWLLAAIGRGLYFNYRYGDPAFEGLNRALLAFFLARVVLFFLVFGALTNDLAHILGLMGLSIAVNGGVRRPVRAPAAPPQPLPIRLRAQLRPAHGVSRSGGV
jgi:hypothetical protein